MLFVAGGILLEELEPIWLLAFTLFCLIFNFIGWFAVPEEQKEDEIATEETEVSETFTSEQEIVEETTQVDVEIELKPEGPEEGRPTFNSGWHSFVFQIIEALHDNNLLSAIICSYHFL